MHTRFELKAPERAFPPRAKLRELSAMTLVHVDDSLETHMVLAPGDHEVPELPICEGVYTACLSTGRLHAWSGDYEVRLLSEDYRVTLTVGRAS